VTEGIAAGPTAPADSARTHPTLLWRLAPLAVALGSLALGLIALGHRSLSTDEAGSLAAADAPLSAVLSRIVHEHPAQAGDLLLTKLALAIGHDERSLRLPSVAAVAVAAGLIVVLGALLLGRVAGLVAGIAFAGNAAVVEASREARPYAVGMLGIVLATLLLVWALERGGGARWVAYALVAAALPLSHPLAASVLAAHGVALLTVKDRRELRAAGIALVTATAAAAVLLAWMAADRRGDPDGSATLDLGRLGHGLGHAGGWNPLLCLAAAAGLITLFAGRGPDRTWWRGALVAGLVAAPVAATLVAAVAVPVFPGALVLAAPGVALAAGAATLLLAGDVRLLRGAVAALALACVATNVVRLAAAPQEDWRALAAAVERVRRDDETVVVVPARSRAAFSYYAPDVQVIRFARNRGAWIAVVARTPSGAIAAARPVVETPRYALLRQFRYGERLRLQHWVRP
jgi:mannosyltransferase